MGLDVRRNEQIKQSRNRCCVKIGCVGVGGMLTLQKSCSTFVKVKDMIMREVKQIADPICPQPV